MSDKQTFIATRVLVFITFITMVVINALANILPIGGVTTGQVSDFYPNLFAPAGFTFAIWGVIYLLLLGYTIYQLGIFQKEKVIAKSDLLCSIGILFSISSIANSCWIFAWHFRSSSLSLLLILVILICLILIMQKLKNECLSRTEKIWIRLPFSIYFGWITVATIANATAFLVDVKWNGFGIDAAIWTAIILLVGVLIAVTTMMKLKDPAYGLVVIWAYIGILAKHLSTSGFASQYMVVIYTAIACIIVLIVAGVKVFIQRYCFQKC